MNQDRKRHLLLWKFLFYPCRVAMRLFFRYRGEVARVPEGPLFILANHTSRVDPVLVGCCFKQQMYFVAGQNVQRMGFFSRFLQYCFAPIQRVKGATDGASALQILRTLRSGKNVCMFPEGNRTFTGTMLPIFPATPKLVKASGATLVTFRTQGGYLSEPRWSSHTRRGRMSGKVVGVYPPEKLKEMSVAEVMEILKRDLGSDAYEEQKKTPVAFRGKRLAEKLETAIYLCPSCRKIDTLVSAGNRFSCSCGLTMTLDDFGFFHGEGLPFPHPGAWDAWQQNALLSYAHNKGESELFGDDGVSLCEVTRDHSVRVAAQGRLRLFRDRLQMEDLVFPLHLLEGIALAERSEVFFTFEKKDYSIQAPYVLNGRKYVDMVSALRNAKEVNQGDGTMQGRTYSG